MSGSTLNDRMTEDISLSGLNIVSPNAVKPKTAAVGTSNTGNKTLTPAKDG